MSIYVCPSICVYLCVFILNIYVYQSTHTFYSWMSLQDAKSLSICVYMCLFVCVYLYVSINWCSVYLHLSHILSICIYLTSISICLSICPYLCIYLHVSNSTYTHPRHPCHMSPSVSVYVSRSVSVYVSICECLCLYGTHNTRTCLYTCVARWWRVVNHTGIVRVRDAGFAPAHPFVRAGPSDTRDVRPLCTLFPVWWRGFHSIHELMSPPCGGLRGWVAEPDASHELG